MVRQDRPAFRERSTAPITVLRHVGAAVFGLGALLSTSAADEPAPVPAPPRADAAPKADVSLPSIDSLLSELLPPASGTRDGERVSSPRATTPRAVARLVGTAAPGLRVTLDGSASAGQPLWYRWVQVQGPATPLSADDQPVVTLAVPGNANSLAYLLLVGNSAGADVSRLTVPVEFKGRSTVSGEVRADAGDDQIGQVGRQVTLNGLRSVPKNRLGYRWIQMAGPKVALKLEDGHVFTFVPQADGLYQFALVVASGTEISEPDFVSVAVGVQLPPSTKEPARASTNLKDLAREALLGIEGGPSAAAELAEAFDGVAGKMDLYGSYAELMVELTRRLEEIVPADAGRRAVWLQRLFAPLTTPIVNQMRSEGIDLTRADGQASDMTRPQRKVLAQQFRVVADGFRSVADGP